ncbi:MAG: EVE domain-containing protein [Deinococcaceae bacterium]
MHWILKTEPQVFSYADLERVGTEPWTGVRNAQARNFMRDMKVGDLALFYHSSIPDPGIVGIARVVRTAYPDPSQFDANGPYFDPKSTEDNPRWSAVDIAAVQKLPHLGLRQLKGLAGLEQMVLLRKGNRLSVMPVAVDEWQIILGRASG